MKGINKFILVGTLGNDPEFRTTAGGLAITTISVATNESWKDKQTGEKKERTEWHRVKTFGRMAEVAAEYLKKGSRVYFEGQIRTEKYTDKEGIERYSTEVYANNMQLLDRVEGGQRPQQGQQRAQRSGPPAQAPSNVPPPATDFDDDVPF
jgi:single-strand DNA-binding protein